MQAQTIGIDLGTTNTVAATLENGRFRFLTFAGRELLPSVMMLKDGRITVGQTARNRAVLYAANCVRSSKTHIADADRRWTIEGRTFDATDVAAEILTEVHRQARRQLGAESPLTAVITVPAYFTAGQIHATRTAGERAGFTVRRILTEPVAAAVAYGCDRTANQHLAVIDIGGGTFDVSILRVDEKNFTTLAVDGDRHLGGDAFDALLLERCLKQIRQTTGIDLDGDPEAAGLSAEDQARARQRLVNECERARIELSEVEAVTLEIPHLISHRGRPHHFSHALTRADLVEACAPLLKKIRRIVRNGLHASGLEPSRIDKVILVGGTSHMPAIQQFVTELFGQRPYADMDLARLVAMGAALVADDRQDGIRIRDLISHSLGVELLGDRFSKILLKNTHYPVEETQPYTTVEDFQEAVTINVYEGEDEENVHNNAFYGTFDLEGIEVAEAGVPRIAVTFAFDQSRDLHVTARDRRTDVHRSIRLHIDRRG